MAILLLGEGEARGGFAFQGFVGVEVLQCGFDVAMAHEFLHRDDVAARLKEARRVGVPERAARKGEPTSMRCSWPSVVLQSAGTSWLLKHVCVADPE